MGLMARVESLLFVADGPVSAGRLAEALEVTPGQVERALSELEATYTGRGLRLQRAGNRVQLITAPEAASYVERFVGLEGTIVGVDRFGASAPWQVLQEKFGFTPQGISESMRRELNR